MAYSLITAPDERDRCCVVVDGVRCPQPSAVRIADAERSWDGYTYACADCAGLVAADGTAAIVEAFGS